MWVVSNWSAGFRKPVKAFSLSNTVVLYKEAPLQLIEEPNQPLCWSAYVPLGDAGGFRPAACRADLLPQLFHPRG